jgi:hypothetical protein
MRRYGEKSFEDLFGISGKWLGLYFEILLNSRGLCLEIHGVWLDSAERQGVICKMVGIFLVFELFSNRKYTSAYGPGLLWLTVDRGQMMRWWLTGAFARGWYEPRGLATRWGK